jgi:hypothetical protein
VEQYERLREEHDREVSLRAERLYDYDLLPGKACRLA